MLTWRVGPTSTAAKIKNKKFTLKFWIFPNCRVWIHFAEEFFELKTKKVWSDESNFLKGWAPNFRCSLSPLFQRWLHLFPSTVNKVNLYSFIYPLVFFLIYGTQKQSCKITYSPSLSPRISPLSLLSTERERERDLGGAWSRQKPRRRKSPQVMAAVGVGKVAGRGGGVGLFLLPPSFFG